jgi:hypothetical protein
MSLLRTTQKEIALTEEAGVPLKVHTCMWEVLGQNLSWPTGYPDVALSWFSSVSPVKYRDTTTIRPRHLPPAQYTFQFIVYPVILQIGTG